MHTCMFQGYPDVGGTCLCAPLIRTSFEGSPLLGDQLFDFLEFFQILQRVENGGLDPWGVG